MRALGLDIGARRVGVALSDAVGIAAHPHSVVQRQGIDKDASHIVALAKELDATYVVVGLPLALDGTVGPRAQRVQKLGATIRSQLPSNIDLVYWDERFSTVAVSRVLAQGGASFTKRKQVVDKQAAAYLLQGWLDSQ